MSDPTFVPSLGLMFQASEGMSRWTVTLRLGGKSKRHRVGQQNPLFVVFHKGRILAGPEVMVIPSCLWNCSASLNAALTFQLLDSSDL